MATELGRAVTYHERLLPIKPHDPLVKLSCKIMRQIKNYNSVHQTWQCSDLPGGALTSNLTRPFDHVAL